MSMNFGRELSLLRIRFTEAGSTERADSQKEATGSEAKFLGAEDSEIAKAADELVETYPQMGRAQMTAFVRTLWQSGVYEMQRVGSHILASRASLLEPPDLNFIEGLIKKCDIDAIAETLGSEVLGTLVAKNKKVWRDLRRMVAGSDPRLSTAAVQACRIPILADESVFARFVDIVEPLFEGDDAALLQEVDKLLSAVAAEHADVVRELAERHGRKIKLPQTGKKKAAAKKKSAPKKSAS